MKYLEELKRKYEELGKEIEKLEKEETTRWRAKKGEKYYSVGLFLKENLRIGEYIPEYESFNFEQNDTIDNFNYKTRNYFKTKEEAEKYKERLKTYYDLMDLADELNNGEKIDWKNDKQRKYFIYYHVLDDRLYCSCATYTKNLGQIYCLDPDFQVKALEIIGEDKLKNLFIGWSSYAK